MFSAMNYLSDLHFVGEGWRRGLASSEDHDDEDSDEEESEDRTHHSSGHSDGVWPLCLRLIWEKVGGKLSVCYKHNNINMTKCKRQSQTPAVNEVEDQSVWVL